MSPVIIAVVAAFVIFAVVMLVGSMVISVKAGKGKTKEYEEAVTEEPIPEESAEGLRPKRGVVVEKKMESDKEGMRSVYGSANPRILYALKIAATDGSESCIFVNKEEYFSIEERQVVDYFVDDDGFVCFAKEETDLHRMTLDDEPFDKIRDGLKTIELRLNDEKRRRVKVGDRICFAKRDGSGDMTVKVVALHRFPSFEELYKKLPLEKCGYTKKEAKTASPENMRKYYTAEDERKYGVVGIEVDLDYVE